MQDDAVIHRQRFGGRAAPLAARGAAFEEGIAVRVEQRAAIGLHEQVLVLDAAMHGAEGGEQARPGIGAAFQHFFAVAVGHFLQLLLQGGDGVVVVVERLAEVQQAALFAENRKTRRIMTVSAES